MAEYTIVVPDASILQRVCGTNDNNLKLIESYLKVPVFACGNRLSIDCDNQELEQQFRFIVDRVLDELDESDNELSDSELIHSVLNTEFNSSSFLERLSTKFSINIPGGVRKIYPRTMGQVNLVKAMRSYDMVFVSGPAGSGKTFLAVAESLNLLLSHKVNQIILTRPVVEAGESLGFLPGALEDKINPYLVPLYDAMNCLLPHATFKRMLESDIIQVAPLAYMRGRTLDNSAVILDEAQNTTKEQMKMFLTRMGENSKVFITGDKTQTDLPHKIQSGLIHALDILADVSEIGIVELDHEDVVRNPLVKRIIQAYENKERKE